MLDTTKLNAASSKWAQFDVITTRSPWQLAEHLLQNRPQKVHFAESLQRDAIHSIADAASDASIVVGIGSGTAMEAAKLVSKFRNKSLIQVPTTASNNAYFTASAWMFDGKTRMAERDIQMPMQVILDEDLILAAPPRLNRAGLAEILCSYTALYDWELGHRSGLNVDWDDDLKRMTQAELSELDHKAAAVGANRGDAILELIFAGARFAPHFAARPKARFNGGSEHIFAWALEESSGKRLIHGEIVALGVLMMAHVQGQDALWPASIIRQAGIHIKPQELGLDWDSVEKAFMLLPDYCANVPWYSVLNQITEKGVDGRSEYKARFYDAKKFIKQHF